MSNGAKLDSKIYIPHELNMTPFMTQSLPKADRTAGPPNLAHTHSNTSLYQQQQQSSAGGPDITAEDVDSLTALNDGLSLGSEYSLFTVVKHVGKMDTGHYTCFAKCGEEVRLCFNLLRECMGMGLMLIRI